ncbi:MAG TPA: carboxymuconolactone decarboxylase family protein, partial [Cyclobacteriaceae bacterium]|nr:carboxymuconolactone decarboxylase family protein [Cyclobacteriaceae bacterium]HNU41967.1 carboxymuconolactone decarboxylase family protein [Cyclobacteriaceae bacterium]
ERAVLALTESMTTLTVDHVPDEIYEEAARNLTEKELAAVIMAIITINSWNRLAITTRKPLD